MTAAEVEFFPSLGVFSWEWTVGLANLLLSPTPCSWVWESLGNIVVCSTYMHGLSHYHLVRCWETLESHAG